VDEDEKPNKPYKKTITATKKTVPEKVRSFGLITGLLAAFGGREEHCKAVFYI
jgi:hypothetical protein